MAVVNGELIRINVLRIICSILLAKCIFAEDTTAPYICNLHLSVSSLQNTAGKLEMNWGPLCNNFKGTINLYDSDPRLIEDPKPLASIRPKESLNGFHLTSINLGSPHLPGGWDETLSGPEHAASPGPHCLPFWIASLHDKTGLQEVNCLKIQPTWMANLKGKIDKILLSKILIPGTHNSGSYHGPGSLVKGGSLQKFTMTQDQNIWNQLVFGIRYFDLRVGYSSIDIDDDEKIDTEESEDGIDEKRLTINHDVVQVRRLAPVLRTIRKFVEKSTGEIVIIDIHRLPVGFHLLNGKMRVDRSKMLVNFLYRELGDLAVEFETASRQYAKLQAYLVNGPKFEDIWASGKKIIICYPEEDVSNSISWLWPPLKQMWGNKQSTAELKRYFKYVMSHNYHHPDNPLWALMAQLTPTALDIFFDPSNDLRKMADSVNRNITRWMDDEFGDRVNIVATDFFLGNNIIDIAVKMAASKAIDSSSITTN